MSKLVLIAIVSSLVAACAGTGGGLPYRSSYYGVQHSTIDEARAVRSSARATALTEIAPLSVPLVDRTLIVNAPTITAVKAHRDAVDPPGLTKPAQGYRDFYDWDTRDSVVFVANAIKRRGLYKGVEIVDMDASPSVPLPTASRDYLFLKFNPQTIGSQLYFVSERTGQVIVAGDASAPSAGRFVQSVLDQITTYALTR